MAEYEVEADTAEAEPKSPSDDEESLLQRLKRWERLARNHWSKWREEARLSYAFVSGDQWSSDDKAALLEQMRQPVTFNRIAPMVDAVTGAEILNRQEVRYLPREQGDVQVNELITAADEWARELADTEDEESDAFADTVICGMGWTETKMDYSDDPEGRIVDERIDPLEMWCDGSQQLQRGCSNSQYLIRARYMDKDTIPEEWKKRLPMSGDGGHQIDDPHVGWTGPLDDYEREDGPTKDRDAQKRQIWVRHIQWWEKEPVWRLADPMTGQAATVTKAQIKQINQMFLRNGMKPPEAVKIEQKVYYEAVLCGSVFLQKKSPIEAKAFRFKCITGKRDRNANIFYGAVRAMVDPQMWGNKFFVQIMHILNTAAKGGLLYEQDSFVNPKKALEDWSKPDAAIELKRGAISGQSVAVTERKPSVFPAGTEKMMEFALNNLPQTSGINLELLGLVEREQPGVLEMQRKKAGYAILAVFFDSLRRYRKSKGRLRLYFIQNYISDGRLIRIKGKDSTMKYVPLVKQQDTATYDVIVDEAPMAPNQKEQTWAMLQAMMPLLAKLNVPPEIWSIMIENSPLPSSVSSKINEVISKQAQEQPPPDPEMIKVQAQLEADKAKMAMEAEQAQQEAAMEQQRQQQEIAFEREKFELEKQGKIIDLQVQREKAKLDIEATLAKLQMDAQVAQQKMAVQAQTDQQKLETQQDMDEQAVAAARAKAAAAPKKAAK